MTHRWPKQVKIVEVGPRDGLQAEDRATTVEERVQFIDALSRTGLKSIEIGSFVSPHRIPQLANTDKVYSQINKNQGIEYSALVPNKKGFEKARELGAETIAIFTAASENFANRNINCSISESYTRLSEFLPDARAAGMRVRGYVSCAVACPFEGPIAPEKVSKVVENLLLLGCDEVSLGDTTGAATPGHVEILLDTLAAPKDKLAVHFHNTYGQALANIIVALEKGITVVDASASGLGGCPYAPGATGNVATEDVVYMLEGMGIETGVDMKQLLKASKAINTTLGRSNQSSVGKASGGSD